MAPLPAAADCDLTELPRCCRGAYPLPSPPRLSRRRYPPSCGCWALIPLTPASELGAAPVTVVFAVLYNHLSIGDMFDPGCQGWCGGRLLLRRRPVVGAAGGGGQCFGHRQQGVGGSPSRGGLTGTVQQRQDSGSAAAFAMGRPAPLPLGQQSSPLDPPPCESAARAAGIPPSPNILVSRAKAQF